MVPEDGSTMQRQHGGRQPYKPGQHSWKFGYQRPGPTVFSLLNYCSRGIAKK